MKKNNFAIVIPSYNESKNIRILIKKINIELSNSSIIIVDDSSFEEREKIKKIVKNYKNVKLITRPKKSGRGSAVLLGFKEATKSIGINYVFEMDSDLAHDPKEFKRFLNEINVFPYDLIIGSRYKSGGKIINISTNRTIMSRIINNFLYIWLGIKISDYTSGFRLYSRSALEYLAKTKIESKGFITLSEVAYKLSKKGFKISEVPITWNYRNSGRGKINRPCFKYLFSLFKNSFLKNQGSTNI
jgi:dolichol-phosphate mannosyltransferase